MQKIKIRLVASAILFLTTSIMAQKQFTLDDLLSGGKTFSTMTPKRMIVGWWGNQIVKREQNSYFVCQKGNKWKELFDLKDIQSVCPKVKTLANATFSSDGSPIVSIKGANFFVAYNWETKSVVHFQELGAGFSDMDYSCNNQYLAFNEQSNLYVLSTQSGEKKQLSTDGSLDIVYGQSVHRNEFGIENGNFWSPNEQLLCFYRMDQSMVPSYPLVDIFNRIATVQPSKYPMAGETSHKVSMGIYNTATGKTIYLQTGDNTDQYYSGITWSPDSKKIFLYNLNRDQNHLRLLQFDAITGAQEKVLYEETHPKYVHPKHGLTFLPWDADKFIYWSEKDGFAHLYLYSLKENKTIRKITGNQLGVVLSIVGFNAQAHRVIISSTGISPIQENLFSVSVDKDIFTLLGNSRGVHQARLSADGKQLLDTWSAPNVPRQTDVVSTATGKVLATLFVAENPWKDYDVPEIISGTIKAADETTDLYYRMVKPTHFDPNKKYPTIVYVYGGPGIRNVESTWNYMTRGWEIYMAQRGYLIFVLDNRGSSKRGRDFEDVTFRQLGTEEMKDQIKGVEFLKSLPYVDVNRMGVHGWSYGGFMTTNLMLTYPDVFKVAVAGGPVIDWSLYEVMYGERYMDTPQANPEGYKGNNLCLRAGNLKGHLLLIFGYNDPVCVPQHTLSFISACADAGVHPDLFTYPGEGHNMQNHNRIHLHEHITRYFDDYLK